MKLAIDHLNGCIARAGLICPPVAAPIGSHEVEPTIAIKISGTHAIPEAAPSTQPRLGGGINPAATLITKEAQGVPVAGEYKIRVSVAIGIGEDGPTDPHFICHPLGFAPTVRPTR